MNFPSRVQKMVRNSLLMAIFIGGRIFAQAPDSQQLVHLSAGWNLASLQVGGAISPDTFKASLSHPARLKQIWGFEPSGSPNIPGRWSVFKAEVPPGFVNDLSSLIPGRAYWMELSQAADLTLHGIPWSGDLSLTPGWNLIGFPGLDLAENESQELSAAFGSSFSKVQQIWTHENDTKLFRGYDPGAIPALKDLTVVRPGMGYWVYASEAFTIAPGPYVILPGDADASPLEPEVDFNAAQFPTLTNPADYTGSLIRKVRPGSEDAALDLNGNGIIDSIFTQNTLKFDVGVDRKVVTVGNRGAGIANWVLSNQVPWLFTSPLDERLYPNNAGRPKTASGVVSTERDAITLYADTRGLQPGLQVGTITLYVGNLARTITVKLDVPGSDGDWKGIATTQRVNGMDIPIGVVDMGINLFMDSSSVTEKGFRAILNKDNSLIFPRDVFMNGVFYSGNDFSLTTNFEMPKGDRNSPPFDTFQKPSNFNSLTPAQQARADYDENGDGKLDVSNPFPFPIRREVTLLGSRTTPNRMEGSYVESITGILPSGQPIFVEGTFYLDRQTFSPTKRSIFNQSTTGNPILIGSTSGQLYRETTINVPSAVSIQGITLTLNVTFPDPTKLTISLIGPNGKTVVIHNGGSILPTSVNLTDYNGLLGSGNWKLRVTWLPTGERGYFTNWGLNIQGLATYSITGKIKGDTNGDTVTEALPGTHLVISGSNLLRETDTDANGVFTIPNLTENNYTLSISRPGFETRLVNVSLNNSSLYVGQGGAVAASGAPDDPLILTPVSVSAPELRAGPFVGQAPLHVTFTALVPLSNLASLGTITSASWNFGDGSPAVLDTASSSDEITQTTAKHIYTQPGVYAATLTLNGSSGSLPVTSSQILVHRITPDSAPGAPGIQCVAAGFVGAFAAPLNTGNVIEKTTTPTGAIVYQESRRDVAAFDIDRSPAMTQANFSDFHPNEEDSDFGDPGKMVYVSGDGSVSTPFLIRSFAELTANEQADAAGDVSPGIYSPYVPQVANGTPVPERFRMIPTLGASVFGTGQPRVGDFVIQIGRIEN